MATCLVTGGAGFLGSHLCDELLRRGNRVICVDNVETGSLANIEHIRVPEFRFLQADIIQPYHVDEPVDFVYHFASPASPIDYLRLPLHTLKVGSHGTHNTLGLAKAHRARFLTASTSEVYGDPKVHPQPESYWGHVNPIGPRGVYDEAKRYAEALTMAYHRQQGVDTAIVRIFNSVLADEQVVYDDGRELRRETVSDAAARLATHAVAAGYLPTSSRDAGGLMDASSAPAIEYPLSSHSVPAFDEDGSVGSAHTSSLIAHPTDERCYELRLRYGRSIRVTGHHSVFVEGSDGAPVAKPVEDIAPGEHVAIHGRLEVPERDRTVVSMIETWRWNEGDPWELCVEAPGLGEQAWEQRFDLHGMLLAQRRNSGPNARNGAWTKLIRMRRSDRLPLPIFWRVASEMPEDAKVRLSSTGRSVPMPARVSISDDLLWLIGLWVAEGSWHERAGDAFLTLSCDDATLDRAEAIIRRELGLHVVRAKGSTERAASLFVHSRLLLGLWAFLGFEGNRKRIPGWILGLPLSRLKWFVEGYREGDGVHSGTRVGRDHVFVTVSDELKDDLVVALARFGLVPSICRGASRIRRCTGDRLYPFWSVSMRGVSPWSPLSWDAGVEQKLLARRYGDLVWAQVKQKLEVEATALVYDFSVPGLENFWAGTGVAAKNTYGPRMRPHDGRAIPTFMRQALQDRPITIFGDGSQTRSFCYVADLVDGIIRLAESGHHFPVNVGNPNEFTLLELAHAVIDVTGSRSELVHESLPEDDPQVRQPDISLAREILGWEPKVELREGLRRTLEEAGVEALTGSGAS